MSTYFAKRLYPAVDATDKEGCRPDFAVVLYPGHLSIAAAEWDAQQGAKKFVIRHPDRLSSADESIALNPNLPVTSQDHVDNLNDSLAYYVALKKAGVRLRCICMRRAGTRLGCGARSFR